VLIVALAVASPTADPARSGKAPPRLTQTDCAGAETPTTSIRRIDKITLCLHNLERAERGLRKVFWNPDLSSVAAEHARDMVSHHYFAHYSSGHRDHMDRIAASAYRPTTGCWTAGENLFSSPGASTPKQLMSAWMNSPAHRAIILRNNWHDFGLGVVTTSPTGDTDGLTIVALFGIRAHHSCS